MIESWSIITLMLRDRRFAVTRSPKPSASRSTISTRTISAASSSPGGSASSPPSLPGRGRGRVLSSSESHGWAHADHVASRGQSSQTRHGLASTPHRATRACHPNVPPADANRTRAGRATSALGCSATYMAGIARPTRNAPGKTALRKPSRWSPHRVVVPCRHEFVPMPAPDATSRCRG